MNDERPIEKLLRRYAQKRGDDSGPPPELHPVTRRLLQDEVTRQFPPTRPRRPAGFGTWLAMRWTYAVAVVAVVGVGAVLLLPPGNNANQESTGAVQPVEMDLAKVEVSESFRASRTESPIADKLDPAAVAPGPPATTTNSFGRRQNVANDRSLDVVPARRLAFSEPAASTPTTGEFQAHRVPTSPASATLSAPVEAAGNFAAGEVGLALAPTARSPITPQLKGAAVGRDDDRRGQPGIVARGGGLEAASHPVRSQAFANTAPPAPAVRSSPRPVVAPVLVNFRVEQIGEEWRVIDGDGSTYLGVPATPVAAMEARQEAAVSVAASPAQASALFGLAREIPAEEAYHFRVTGTNRTLQQQVLFTWNFVAPSNATALPEPGGGGSPALPWANSQIQGQVQINAGPRFELNAVPVAP